MITTSYFGNRKKPKGTLVAIVRHSFPFINKEYELQSSFAPSKELLREYKNGKISWRQYTSRYRTEQRRHFKEKPEDFRELLERATVEDIVLCCYEKYQGKRTQCHRLLLYDFLSKIAERESIDVDFIAEQ